MSAVRFERADFDHYCYQRKNGSESVILIIYVDDMLIASFSMSEIKLLEARLSKKFDMKDLGEARQILGIGISRSTECIKLSQQKYLQKMLDKFHCDSIRTDLPLTRA